jgi:phosphatidate cytidylyltransferase
MAFNLNTFRTRALTAVVFVIVMGIGLLWNHWSFFILFSIIHFGCWFEYQQLMGKIEPGYTDITPFHKWGIMIAGWCLMLFLAGEGLDILGFKLPAIGLWLGMIALIVLPVIELLFEDNIRPRNISISAAGLLYISLSWALMMELYKFPHIKTGGIMVPVMPLLVIFSIWINDTMAYISGSLVGKTPLSKISPKKTWEGTIIGAVLSIALIGTLASRIIGDQLPYAHYHYYIISGIAAVTGTFGDLLESKIKRLAGVKDSGHFMPGHGGFLDRFDSLLVAIPCVWLYVVLALSLNL